MKTLLGTHNEDVRIVRPREVDTDAVRGARIPRALRHPLALLGIAAVIAAAWRFVPFIDSSNVFPLILAGVACAGFFLGFASGFAASIAALVAHVLIHNAAGHGGISTLWNTEPGMHVLVLLLGPALGRLRTLERRVRAEAARRRGTEYEMRASARHYRMMVEQMREGVLQCANDGTIVYCNRQMCEMTGYGPDELVGANARDLLIPADHHGFLDEHMTQRLLGTASAYRIPMRTRADDIAWFEVNGAPIHDDDGHVVGRFAMYRDITAEVMNEQRADLEHRALVDAEARFQQLVEGIQDALWVSTVEQDRLIYMSPGIERITGLTVAHLYHDPHRMIDMIHPTDRPRVEETLREPAADGYDVDFRIETMSGEVRRVRVRAFPVTGDDGVTKRLAGITSDVTRASATDSLRARVRRQLNR